MAAQLQIPVVIEGVVDPAAGERAKTAGIAAADEHTEVDWASACDAAIDEMARRGVVFQAADLVAEGLVDEPDHPARWGARFSAAAKRGVIVHAGVVQSSRATVHRSLCRQWIGSDAARAGGDAA
jgi:hypothetical protein